jgi:hypothetical protein
MWFAWSLWRLGLLTVRTHGRIAGPFQSAYHATKYALEGLSESLRFELKPHGIHVKLVEPAHFKTDFIARSPQWAMHRAYEPQLGNLMAWVSHSDQNAPSPEPVAETIFKAATDPSERLRYPVKGRLFLVLRAILPDAIWRSMLGAGMNRRPKKLTPHLKAQAPRFVRGQSIRQRPPGTGTQNNRFSGVPCAWWESAAARS